MSEQKPSNRFNPILLIFLIFPIGGLLFAVLTSNNGANPGNNLTPPAVEVTSDTLIGRSAPDFELPTLAGGTVRLSALRGKPTFLNFWAVSCAPCRQEMPAFQAFLDGKILGEANILTVNQGDDTDSIHSFFNEIKVNLPTALDSKGNVMYQYRVINLPITYVIDKKGVVIDRHIGIMDADAIIAYLDKMKKMDG
jgi:peroxiredoxin